jgi:hypothetical protein
MMNSGICQCNSPLRVCGNEIVIGVIAIIFSALCFSVTWKQCFFSYHFFFFFWTTTALMLVRWKNGMVKRNVSVLYLMYRFDCVYNHEHTSNVWYCAWKLVEAWRYLDGSICSVCHCQPVPMIETMLPLASLASRLILPSWHGCSLHGYHSGNQSKPTSTSV